MTNYELLRDVIKRSGFKMQFVAESIGLSYQGFLNKLKGLSQFGNIEIYNLCVLLHIDEELMMRIFFPALVDET